MYFQNDRAWRRYAEIFMAIQKLSTVEDCKNYKKPWFLCDEDLKSLSFI